MSELDRWVIGGLVAIFGFIFLIHLRADGEFKDRVYKEIDLLRSRVHDISNRIAEILVKLK